MRIPLDECLPRKLRQHLPGHFVRTVPQMGWAGLKNGPLFALVEGQFDVFITSDQNIPHQQNIQGRSFVVLILVAPDNRLETLAPLMPAAAAALATAQPGAVIQVGPVAP
jgi:hypothetical protein